LTAGFTYSRDNADIAIVNSCAVTGKSEQKSRRIGRLKAKEAMVTIMTGCSASVSRDALGALAANIVVVGSEHKEALLGLPLHLAGRTKNELFHETAAFISSFDKKPFGAFDFTFDTAALHTRPGLKIQEGCDRACSYCITRIARGKALSLDSREIIRRLNVLIDNGYKEAVLTGINLASYSDPVTGCNLWGLLRLIFDETAGIRIRLSSLEPQFITDEAADVLSHERLCPHFHLSLQSGSSRILKAMRRPYTAEAVKDAAAVIRRYKDDPFIACDIIAGFPGEDDNDFKETVALLEHIDISFIHAFAFSPRPGTAAAGMTDKVPERIRDQRVAALNALADKALSRYYERSRSRVVEVILESGTDNGLKRCRSNYYHDLWVADVPQSLKAGALFYARITEGRKAVYHGDITPLASQKAISRAKTAGQ
jgi:threonylcarbamoyladenosine tRNA methylthiotransferase MtaB